MVWNDCYIQLDCRWNALHLGEVIKLQKNLVTGEELEKSCGILKLLHKLVRVNGRTEKLKFCKITRAKKKVFKLLRIKALEIWLCKQRKAYEVNWWKTENEMNWGHDQQSTMKTVKLDLVFVTKLVLSYKKLSSLTEILLEIILSVISKWNCLAFLNKNDLLPWCFNSDSHLIPCISVEQIFLISLFIYNPHASQANTNMFPGSRLWQCCICMAVEVSCSYVSLLCYDELVKREQFLFTSELPAPGIVPTTSEMFHKLLSNKMIPAPIYAGLAT